MLCWFLLPSRWISYRCIYPLASALLLPTYLIPPSVSSQSPCWLSPHSFPLAICLMEDGDYFEQSQKWDSGNNSASNCPSVPAGLSRAGLHEKSSTEAGTPRCCTHASQGTRAGRECAKVILLEWRCHINSEAFLRKYKTWFHPKSQWQDGDRATI